MKSHLPQKTEKPWGYELLFAHTTKYAGKVIFVKKGHRLSFQYHEKKDEAIYMYEGKCLLEIQTENGDMMSKVFNPGESILIPPLTRHRLEALEDTTFIEVSTPELEDVVRLQDDYGRAR
jgi:mannose-6-phosphate isomerase-like protein (cupin superfamily)